VRTGTLAGTNFLAGNICPLLSSTSHLCSGLLLFSSTPLFHYFISSLQLSFLLSDCDSDTARSLCRLKASSSCKCTQPPTLTYTRPATYPAAWLTWLSTSQGPRLARGVRVKCQGGSVGMNVSPKIYIPQRHSSVGCRSYPES
jgi:hypothetical protein